MIAVFNPEQNDPGPIVRSRSRSSSRSSREGQLQLRAFSAFPSNTHSPLYSRKLHILVRRDKTSWVTSLIILAFSLGDRVVNHFASLYCNPRRKRVGKQCIHLKFCLGDSESMIEKKGGWATRCPGVARHEDGATN